MPSKDATMPFRSLTKSIHHKVTGKLLKLQPLQLSPATIRKLVKCSHSVLRLSGAWEWNFAMGATKSDVVPVKEFHLKPDGGRFSDVRARAIQFSADGTILVACTVNSAGIVQIQTIDVQRNTAENFWSTETVAKKYSANYLRLAIQPDRRRAFVFISRNLQDEVGDVISVDLTVSGPSAIRRAVLRKFDAIRNLCIGFDSDQHLIVAGNQYTRTGRVLRIWDMDSDNFTTAGQLLPIAMNHDATRLVGANEQSREIFTTDLKTGGDSAPARPGL
jgi:hypothetical protein